MTHLGFEYFLGFTSRKNLWYFPLFWSYCFPSLSLFCQLFVVLFTFIVCFTSLVSFTGSYTEDEPFFCWRGCNLIFYLSYHEAVTNCFLHVNVILLQIKVVYVIRFFMKEIFKNRSLNLKIFVQNFINVYILSNCLLIAIYFLLTRNMYVL